MRPEDRLALRQRFGFRCGYCGVHENEIGAELTADHFQPRSRGGSEAPDNLVYCCHACNEFKADHWEEAAPERILHPLRDNYAEHFQLDDDGRLRALTETGTFHLERLRLNRPQLVTVRLRRRMAQQVLARQEALIQGLRQLERQADDLAALLEEFESRSGESPT